jgi:hypothetical protein
MKNKYWYYPVDDKGHEAYSPVGRDLKAYSSFCGVWNSLSVCKNVDGHKDAFLDGADCSGKVVVRHNHYWCNSPRCCVCFIHGYSSRQARRTVGRLNEGSKRGLGEAEHIIASPCVADRDLPEPILRKKIRQALLDRGVSGSALVFHGYRVNEERGVLEWSPHYHGLGFIENGYPCRDCEKTCSDFRNCTGFVNRSYRCFERDGYIVKVKGKRKTLVGSAWYELNHATIRQGVKRFHCVTYFGSLSYSKFKSEKVKTEISCPACGEEMVKSIHVGKRPIVKDVRDAGYHSRFVDDEFDGDMPNYIDRESPRVG